MGWRDVQAGVASGEIDYTPKPNIFGDMLSGFASVYAPTMTAKQNAKIKADALTTKNSAAEKKRLRVLRETQEKEDSAYMDQAKQIALNLGENPDDPGIVTYFFNQIKTFGGDANKVETDWQAGTNLGNRTISAAPGYGSSPPPADDSALGILTEGESNNDYNALLIGMQGKKKTYFETAKQLTQMTTQEVFDLTNQDGEYFKWSKINMPKNTSAYRQGKASTPVGKYQFLGSTLKDFVGSSDDPDSYAGTFVRLGINKDTLFNEETQDKLFREFARIKLLKAGDNPAAKRDAMRNTWEFLARKDDNKQYLISDGRVDQMITELGTGTADFSKLSPVREAGETTISFDQTERQQYQIDFTGMDTVDKIAAEVNTIAGNSAIPDAEKQILFQQLEDYQVGTVARSKRFDFGDFVEENRITSSATASGAITAIEANENISPDDKARYIAQLTDQWEEFTERDVTADLGKEDAVVFYKVGENGMIGTGSPGVLVKRERRKVQNENGDPVEKTVFVDLSGKVVDIEEGFLTSQKQDLNQTIKIYNEPIMEASELVENGVSAIVNLLQYRELVVNNPAVMNNYLTALSGLTNEIEAMGSTIVTLAKSDSGYEQVELAFGDILDSLGTNQDKVLFQMQLKAAYDQAKLEGSSGQGLSDKELLMNLDMTGKGERAGKAVLSINRLINSTLRRVNRKRKGKMGGIIQRPEFKGSWASLPIGQNFKTYAVNTLTENGDDNLIIQLSDAIDNKRDLKNSASKTDKLPSVQITPEQMLAAFTNGETITVTIELKEKYGATSPLIANARVGQSIKKP